MKNTLMVVCVKYTKRKGNLKVYADAPGFSCPGVPILPNICIFFNMFLFGQLHEEAWVRFVVLCIVMIGVYAIYGQYHANPSAEDNIYIEAPVEEDP